MKLTIGLFFGLVLGTVGSLTAQQPWDTYQHQQLEQQNLQYQHQQAQALQQLQQLQQLEYNLQQRDHLQQQWNQSTHRGPC